MTIDLAAKLPMKAYTVSEDLERVYLRPEVETALDHAYKRGLRGDELMAAWREADIPADDPVSSQSEKGIIPAAPGESGVTPQEDDGMPPPPGGAGASQKETPQVKQDPISKDFVDEGVEAPGAKPAPLRSPETKPSRGKTKQTRSKPSGADDTLSRKWGKETMRGGFTAVPNVVLRNQKKLGLSHLDMLLLIHLLKYWWDAKDLPWPSKARLAADVNASESTVRKRTARMEKLGYVTRVYRKDGNGGNHTNVYDLAGLVEAAKRLAAVPDPNSA